MTRMMLQKNNSMQWKLSCQSVLIGVAILLLANGLEARRLPRAVSSTPTTMAELDLRGGGKVLKRRQPKPKQKQKASTKKAVKSNNSNSSTALSKIDIGAFFIYFCTSVTMTLPVLIVPMMDVELQQQSSASTTQQALGLAATVASMAPLGGGFGKLVNGFVCQAMGGSRSSKLYFVGSALASWGLASISLSPPTSTSASTTVLTKVLSPDNVGWMVAAIEFCASIQWTVCSLIMSRYYATQPKLFARGVTILSLASTSGQILSKITGAFLLQYYLDWRQLSLGMCWMATLGFVMSTWTNQNLQRAMDRRAPVGKVAAAKNANSYGVSYAIRRVLGSKMFWLIGLAHVAGYLTRTSDRVIGSFLQDITSLSPQFCGGLTAFITVGFVYGLMTSSKTFYQPSATVQSRLQLLRRGYIRVVMCVCGLVLSALLGRKPWMNPYVCAILVTACASIMAASVAFSFFQIPNMVSSVYFPEVKPVALSLIDGTGFFLTSPIWKVYTGTLLPRYGWAVSWGIVAVLVAGCGSLMMTTIPNVLAMQTKKQR